MMNRLFIAFLIPIIVSIESCKHDEFPVCDCDGNHNGLLCMEYYFDSDGYQSKKQYKYNNKKQKVSLTSENKEGRLQYTYYELNEAGLITKEEWNSKSVTDSIITFKYDNSGEIISREKEIHGNKVHNIDYFYNYKGFQTGSNTYLNGELHEIETKEYDSKDKLWKIAKYSRDSALIKYDILHFYDNDIIKIEQYNSKGEKTGYRLIFFNEEGVENRRVLYDKQGIVLTDEKSTFKEGSKIETTIQDGNGRILNRTTYIYYTVN